MKYLIWFIPLCLLLLAGCGNKIDSKTNPVTPSRTIFPTPSLTPTTMPIPTLTPLDKKYQNYDENYDNGTDIDKTKIVPMTDINTIEEILANSIYYRTWYGYGESTYGQKFVVNKFKRDNKEYGIKLIVENGKNDLLIFYYYLTSPETIYQESIYEEDGVYINNNNSGPFSNLTAEEYESYMNQPEQTSQDELSDDLKMHLYDDATLKAQQKIASMYDIEYSLVSSANYSFPDIGDAYMEFNGIDTCNISFSAEFKYSSLFDILNPIDDTYFCEFEYVLQEGVFKLKKMSVQ